MAKHTEKIAARIPEHLAAELDEICRRENLRNRSDALRLCIEQYVECMQESVNTSNFVVSMPSSVADMLDRCVAGGLATSRNEAVIIAVHMWLDRNMAIYSRGELHNFQRNLSESSESMRARKSEAREQGRRARG